MTTALDFRRCPKRGEALRPFCKRCVAAKLVERLGGARATARMLVEGMVMADALGLAARASGQPTTIDRPRSMMLLATLVATRDPSAKEPDAAELLAAALVAASASPDPEGEA